MNDMIVLDEITRNDFLLELVKGLPTALVALVIGLIAAGIAHRQYGVARGKLNLDLFDQRYAVYEIIWQFLSACTTVEHTERRGIRQTFSNSISKAHFLFGAEIADFMTEAISKNSLMAAAERRLDTLKHGAPNYSDIVAEIMECESYFEDCLRDLRERFGPYMDFKEWVGRPSITERTISFLRTEVRIRITY